MQKYVNIVDLVKSFPDYIILIFFNVLVPSLISNEYLLLAKVRVDTAENEPLQVHLIFQPWDSIFTKPPRPLLAAGPAAPNRLLASEHESRQANI